MDERFPGEATSEADESEVSGLRTKFAVLDSELFERIRNVDTAAVVPDNAGADRARYVGEFEPMSDLDRDPVDSAKKWAAIMQPTNKPHGHGGGSSGRLARTKPRKMTPGRYPIEDEPRSVIPARASSATRRQLASANVNASTVLADVAKALASGLTYDEIVSRRRNEGGG